MAFDAVVYKETTKQQWEEAAEAWHRWGPTWRSGSARRRKPCSTAPAWDGSRVLDVAGGAGGQASRGAAYWRTAASWSLTCRQRSCSTPSAPPPRRAATRHVTEADGEELGSQWSRSSTPPSVGWVSSTSPTRHERSGSGPACGKGPFPAIVYSTAERNAFFSVPVKLIRERAGLGAPLPGQPGPFSLGDAAAAREALVAAGFSDVSVTTLSAPLRLSSAAECVRFERESFGALHQMLSGVPEQEREQVWADIEVALW